jgi:hypothetical protein
MQFGGLKEAIIGSLRSIATNGAEAITDLVEAVADLTYWNPHPEFNSVEEFFLLPPDHWGIWASLWEYHINRAVPIALVVLIVPWFARRAGVATNILGQEERMQSNRNLLSGVFAVFLSFHAVAAYLNVTQFLVVAIAPNSDEISRVSLEFAGASGAAAIAIVFLNVSINSLFIIVLFLINAARILGTFLLPVLVPYTVALIFARVPLLTGQVKKITKLLAASPLWTIPVAAGWRLMVILSGATGDSRGATIGTYLIDQAGVDFAGSGVAEQLLTTSLFMVPVLIGIIAPLKMTGAASSAFYLSRLTGFSVGSSPSGGSNNSNNGSNDGDGGLDDDKSSGGDDSGISSRQGDGSGGRSGSQSDTGSGGASSSGTGNSTTTATASAGNDNSLFEDAKDAFSPVPDKQYLDQEKVDVTKRAGAAAKDTAKSAAGEAKEAGEIALGEDNVETLSDVRESISDQLSGAKQTAAVKAGDAMTGTKPDTSLSERERIKSTDGFKPGDRSYNYDVEMEDLRSPATNSSTESSREVTSSPSVPSSDNVDTGGVTPTNRLDDLFEGGSPTTTPEGAGRYDRASGDEVDYGEDEEFEPGASTFQSVDEGGYLGTTKLADRVRDDDN